MDRKTLVSSGHPTFTDATTRTIFSRLISGSILSAIIFAVFGAEPTQAQLIDYTFSGTVTHSTIAEMPVSSNISGAFTINYDAPLTYSGPSFDAYSAAFTNFSLSVGSTNSDSAFDRDFLVYDSAVKIEDIPGTILGHSFDCSLLMPSDTAFADHSLNNAIGLEHWDPTGFFIGMQVFGLGGTYSNEMWGDIHSVSVKSVPEPSTLALSIVGLLGMVVAVRRRSSTKLSD